MNQEYFSNEVHNYIDNIFIDFENHRNIIREIFTEFHRLCQTYDIEYYIFYGNLLAYIRDNNDFTPWDIDFDVVVPIDNISKLLKLFDEELDSKYYYVSNYNELDYNYCQIRLCKKGYESKLVHLDIFYLIGAPDRPELQSDIKNSIKRYCIKRKYSTDLRKKFKNNKIKLFLHALYGFAKGKYVPQLFLEKEFKSFINNNHYKDANYVYPFFENVIIFPKELFQPHKISLGYSDAIIPYDSKTVLELIYGNYTKYMPIENRFKEFVDGNYRLLNKTIIYFDRR